MRVLLAIIACIICYVSAIADEYPVLQFNVDNRHDTGITCDTYGNVVYVDAGKVVSSDWFNAKYGHEVSGTPACSLIGQMPVLPPARYQLVFGDPE